MEKCLVEWCNCKQTKYGKGYCQMHRGQISKYGHVTNYRPNGKRNEYLIKDDYAEIHVLDSQGNIKAISIIDKEDVGKVKNYSFHYEKGRYLRTSIEGESYYLHQILMGKHLGMDVDHINRNRLDNRKENLRVCSPQENRCNRKNINKLGVMGVVEQKDKKNRRFRAYYSNKFLGYFKTMQEARQARLDYEMQIFNKIISVNME